MQNSTLSHFAYSTEQVAPHERFDYWTEVVLRHCIPAASQSRHDAPFTGELHVDCLGQMDVCHLDAQQHYWNRSQRHVRTTPQDDIWLGFIEQGFGQLSQGGRSTRLSANDLVLYDAAQGFELEIGGKNNHLFRIPRHLISPYIPHIGQLTAIRLDEKRPGVVPLREMLRQAAHQHDHLDSRSLVMCQESILQLLSLSIETQNFKVLHHEQDLYSKLIQYITQNLSSTELSLEHLAQTHHVSTRTVSRAFARHQQTAMQVIWQMRLEKSFQKLKQGNVRSISQLALDLGFSDFSHFSHAFKKTFGQSPQTLLKH